MGYFHEHSAPVSLNEHVKILGDEELLDFWEESQYLEGVLHEHHAVADQPSENYERLILQELQLRFCRREQTHGMLPVR
jgi:hypothetical protein